MFYINNLCSLCLVQNKEIIYRSSIDSNAEDMLERIIPEFLQQTLGIQKKLCDECLGSLTILFEFRRKCLENISIFDEYIKKLQSGHGSYKYLTIAITDIELDTNRVFNKEIILNEDTCCLGNDVRTDCLKIYDNIEQDNSCNRDSNEEQEENDQRNDVAFDIKEETSEGILLDEDTCLLEDNVLDNCFEIDDNIEQENPCNRNSNEEQEENDQKSDVAFDIKEETSEEISLDEDTCLLEVDFRTYCLKLVENIKPEHCYNREPSEEQDGNYEKSYETLRTPYGNDIENTDEPENQELDSDEHSKCTECGVKFYNRMRGIDSHKCQNCQTEFPDTNTLNKSKRVRSVNKSHACNTCQNSFNSFSSLKEHERVHTGDKFFSCSHCGKRYKQRHSVKVHQRRVHTHEKPFVCEICQKGFVTASELRSHSFTHSDERSFECDVCQKPFKNAKHLRAHKVIHTRSHLTEHKRIDSRQKPFQCDLCGKSFLLSANLKLHSVTHCSEKPYPCNICKKRFTRANYVRQHQLLHTNERPFKCDICARTFAFNALLKCHKRTTHNKKPNSYTICQQSFYNLGDKLIHTGEKEFLCDVCPKKFRYLGHLRDHKRIHDGTKPFKCGICGKLFRLKSSHTRHKRVCHKNSESLITSVI